MEYFGDILWQTSVYTKFWHLCNALMGSISKYLMNKLSIEIATHARDAWIIRRCRPLGFD